MARWCGKGFELSTGNVSQNGGVVDIETPRMVVFIWQDLISFAAQIHMAIKRNIRVSKHDSDGRSCGPRCGR